MSSPFADSVYAQPKLTHLVRQYDRNPGTGEFVFGAVAQPSAAAVAADAASVADAHATGVAQPSTTRAALTSHRDTYRDFFDSTSIKRDYTG